MSDDYLSAGLARGVSAKLVDALIATLIVAIVVLGLNRGSVRVLHATAKSWARWAIGVNWLLQFSCYMRTGTRSAGDALVGIKVVRDDRRVTWRTQALYRAVVSGMLFELRWPPSIFVIFVWLCTIWHMAIRREGRGDGLPWDLGTKAVVEAKQGRR